MKKHLFPYLLMFAMAGAAGFSTGCGGGDDDDDASSGSAGGQGSAPASLAGYTLRVQNAGENQRVLDFAENSVLQSNLGQPPEAPAPYTYVKTGPATGQATINALEGTYVIEITFTSPTQGHYSGIFTPAGQTGVESFNGTLIHATAPAGSGGGGNETGGGGTTPGGSDPVDPGNGGGGVVAPTSLAGKTLTAQMTSGALTGSNAVINFTANGFDAAASEGVSSGTYEYHANGNMAVLVLVFAGAGEADRAEAQLTFTTASSGTVAHTQFSSDEPPQGSGGTFTLQ